ncbi:adenine phosphoribosyltransferase [Corynebacterium sphenisci DSM 44792]|uniref:Adenine phosphoribosyltransferase n=1 Tax=Corynebacterium sphenisci DSM 44792 TaxID=1437874 RepID=A0A1L7CXX8_9CORY|nr:adenine phosphoribosyltransferase [Corynebacterium sphenisci]APT90684.1 adenine phosphoribosyltransferase [Corynebacterium sphenisci DSM 44792]
MEAPVTHATAQQALSDLIRLVPDFPEEGILFEDLTPALADAGAFRLIIEDLAAACAAVDAELIAGLDARGFLLGSAVAYSMGLGVLAVRKEGKLPPPVHREDYQLEYGTAALEVPAGGIPLAGRRVALVDDVLATGGTMGAARALLEACGAEVVGVAAVLEVPDLGGRGRFPDLPVHVVKPVREAAAR